MSGFEDVSMFPELEYPPMAKRSPKITDPNWIVTGHTVVRNHGTGVSSDELGDYITTLAALARKRILGVGADQYDLGTRQKFEDMSIEELREAILEEVADIFSYAAMIAIKIGAARG